MLENSLFIEVSEGCYVSATRKDPHILFIVGRMGMDYDFTGWKRHSFDLAACKY